MQQKFVALPTDAVRALQAGGPDAYGHAPRLKLSDGDEVPCRHCLRDVPAGARYLVLAYRPLAALHPYAETGPIFLCVDACERAAATARLPQILSSPDYIVRGYDSEEAIVYGTGAVTERERITTYADALLANEAVAFVHVRSARNNCFQCRIERAGVTA